MPSSPVPWLADVSLRASVVILLILGLRPILRRWIGSRAVAWLWLAIGARLLCPIPISIPWHLPSSMPALTSAAVSPFAFRVTASSVDVPDNHRAAAGSRLALPLRIHPDPNILTFLWLAGVLLTAIRLAQGWWVTRRWAAQTFESSIHPRLQSVYLTLPAELRRGVEVRLTDFLDLPTFVGVLSPQIWLPRTLPDALTSAELRHVLLHELGHAHRRDLLAQWLCALTCCLHWFNPLVWLMARLGRIDRELACDAWVLAHDALQTDTAASYGHALLKVVEGMNRRISHALPVVSMAAGKRHLDLRVREICAFRLVASWRGVAALVVLSALMTTGPLTSTAAGLLVGAAAPEPVTASPPVASPSAPANGSPVPTVPPLPASEPSTRPRQVEIESKFIEIAKSDALALEKSEPSSSPVARVFQQVFARFAGPASPEAPTIFRSAPVLPRDFASLVRRLNQTKGIDLLSAPHVTTKSAQKATIEIIREFIYPTAFQQSKGPFAKPVTVPTNFDKKNTGVTLEVTPTIEPDRKVIDLSLTWTIANFDGFVDVDGKPISTDKEGVPEKMPGATFPVFDTRSVSTVATLPSGATVVFSRDEEHLFARKSLRFAMGEAKRADSPVKDEARLLLVFVTATLVDPSPSPPAGTGGSEDDSVETGLPETAQPPLPPVGSPASLPYGTPVPGRPGYATSPYASDAGYVDLRGFPRGQEVRDPYTGKTFLVP